MPTIMQPGQYSGRQYSINIAGEAPTPEEQARIDQYLAQQEAPYQAAYEQLFGPMGQQAQQVEQIEEPEGGFGTAIGIGFDALQGAYGSALEGVGNLLGIQGLSDYGRETVEANNREIEEAAAGLQRREDIDSVGDAFNFFIETLGQQVPQIGTSLAGAGAGALAGSFLGPIGSAVGATVGGIAANIPYFYGDNREAQKEAIEKGLRTEMDEGAAFLASLPQATIDSIFDRFLVGKVLNPKWLGSGGLFTRLGKGTAAGAATEVPTEIGQEVINRYQAGLPIDDAEAIKAYEDVAIAAGLVGGTIKGTTNVVSGDVKKKAEAKEREKVLAELAQDQEKERLRATRIAERIQQSIQEGEEAAGVETVEEAVQPQEVAAPTALLPSPERVAQGAATTGQPSAIEQPQALRGTPDQGIAARSTQDEQPTGQMSFLQDIDASIEGVSPQATLPPAPQTTLSQPRKAPDAGRFTPQQEIQIAKQAEQEASAPLSSIELSTLPTQERFRIKDARKRLGVDQEAPTTIQEINQVVGRQAADREVAKQKPLTFGASKLAPQTESSFSQEQYDAAVNNISKANKFTRKLVEDAVRANGGTAGVRSVVDDIVNEMASRGVIRRTNDKNNPYAFDSETGKYIAPKRQVSRYDVDPVTRAGLGDIPSLQKTVSDIDKKVKTAKRERERLQLEVNKLPLNSAEMRKVAKQRDAIDGRIADLNQARAEVESRIESYETTRNIPTTTRPESKIENGKMVMPATDPQAVNRGLAKALKEYNERLKERRRELKALNNLVRKGDSIAEDRQRIAEIEQEIVSLEQRRRNAEQRLSEPSAPVQQNPIEEGARRARETANQAANVKKSQAFTERQQNVFNALRKRLSNLGLSDVKLVAEKVLEADALTQGNLVQGQMQTTRQRSTGEAIGNRIIALSMEIADPNLSAQEQFDVLKSIMNHEVIHALKSLGVFTDKEYQTLVSVAKKKKYVFVEDGKAKERSYTYFDRAEAQYSGSTNNIQEEEAVAELFRDWMDGKIKFSGKPRSLFERIKKFFQAIFKANQDAGFTDVEQIFEGIKKGEVGGRNRSKERDYLTVDLEEYLAQQPQDSDTNQELVTRYSQQKFTPRLNKAPEGVRAHNLPDMLLVRGTGAKPAFKITQKYTPQNADANNLAIEEVIQKHPNALMSVGNWARAMQDAFGGDYLPTPPLVAMEYAQDPAAMVEKLKQLRPELLKGVDEGYKYVSELRDIYASGRATPRMTMDLFIWGILSRGAGPVQQEAAFIDAIDNAYPLLEKATREPLTEDDIDTWETTVMPALREGSPGKQVTMNLRAAGRLIQKLSEFVPGSGNNMTVINLIHDMMSDPNVSAPAIREAFLSNTQGAGIDNKVLSFIIFVAGKDDVLIMDRIQGRHLWDDGRYGGANIYDGIGPNNDGLSNIVAGPRGLLVTRLIEDALRKNVDAAYQAVGRPEDASLGRWHWETWVIEGDQVVNHSTLKAIIDGSPIGNMVTEGKTDTYSSGMTYIRAPEGTVVSYPLSDGTSAFMTPMQFKDFTDVLSNDAKRKKSKTGVFREGNFKVTARADVPWYTRPEIDREQLDRLAKEYENARPDGSILESDEGPREGHDASIRGNSGIDKRYSKSAIEGRGGRRGAVRPQGWSNTPLENAPRTKGATGPIPEIVRAARKYAAKYGIPLTRQSEYVDVDEELAVRIANAFEQMEHNPQDPEVKEAYWDLINQTKSQYQALVDEGFEFYFFDPQGPDPYGDSPGGFSNPYNAIRDLRQNRRMAVYPSEEGFGTRTPVNLEMLFELASDEGLLSEYPGVGKGIERYVEKNEYDGLVEDAWNDPDYEAYYNDLQRILNNMFPDGKIPVSRIEGYGTLSDRILRKELSEADVDKIIREREYTTVKVSDVMFVGEPNEREVIVNTEDGFKSFRIETLETTDIANNPLLRPSGIMWAVGTPDGPKVEATANDIFRAVHDAFGHGMEGAGFRGKGEENAWQAHAALFTGPALKALTTETRGQNSWLNYGPYGESNRTAKVEETVFADQKVGIMPEFTWTEGRVDYEPETDVATDTRMLRYNIASTNPAVRLAQDVERSKSQLQYARASNFLAKALGYVLPKAKAQDIADKVLLNFQDRMLPVGRMIQELSQNGLTITDMMDPYLKEELYHGKVGAQITARENTIYKELMDALKDVSMTNQQIENLARVSTRANRGQPGFVQQALDSYESKRLALADAYLYALHAKERNAYVREIDPDNDKGSGMSDAEADAILNFFASLPQAQRAKIDVINRKAQQIVADTNNTRVEYGLIPSEFVEIMTPEGQRIPAPNFNDYVPLRGMMDPNDTDGDVMGAPKYGPAYGVRGREDKKIGGRDQYATDIIATMLNQNQNAVARGERNRVGQAFLELIRTGTEENKEMVGRYGFVLDKLPKGTTPFMLDKNPHILSVKENGKDKFIYINDARIAKAMNGETGYGSGAAASVLKFMSSINRYLSSINTSYNPEFFITNFFRDLQTAGVNLGQYERDGLVSEVRKGVLPALKGIRASIRDGDKSSEWAKIYQEFVREGGQNATNQMNTVEDQMRNIRGMLGDISDAGARGQWNKVKNGFVGKSAKSLLSFLEDYNTMIENGVRVATYQALKNKIGKERAAQAARNITVNFAKGGEQKQFMNAMYLFYNASLQGSFAMLNALLRSPRVQKMWLATIAAGAMQDVINSFMFDEDDDGKSQYDKIPDYILEHNIILYDPFGFTDRSFISIPMPYGLNMAYNAGRAASKFAMGRESIEDTTNSLVGTAVDTLSPIGGIWEQGILNAVAPTVADPFVDIARNEDFSGKPIYKEGFPGDRGPESQRYWTTTSPSAKWITNTLNELTGGTGAIPGLVDINPDVLEFIFDYTTGGVGRTVQRFVELPSVVGEVTSGERSTEELYRAIPFFRKVIGSVSEREDTGEYIEKRDRVLLIGDEIRDAIRSRDTERLQEAQRLYKKELSYLPRIRAIENARRKVSQQMNAIRDNTRLAEPVKERLLERLAERRAMLAKRGSQILADL